jgi:hypothetical protein
VVPSVSNRLRYADSSPTFEARAAAGPVDLHPRIAGQFLGQLDREAVGVVQGERHVAPEHLLPGGERLLQAAQPGPQGAVEAGLLAGEHAQNDVVILHQRGPGLP